MTSETYFTPNVTVKFNNYKMICLFSIKYSDSKAELLQRLRVAIANSDGSLSGNTLSGSFTGKTLFGTFKGRYTIDGVITVIIDEKPFSIGCGSIEREVTKYLESVQQQ